MFGLLVIFGHLWGEPWYGHNTSLLEGFTAGPPHVQLTGGFSLSVPGPIAAQIACCAALDLVEKPQGACRHHDHTTRIGTDDALPLPALLAPQPSVGVGVTHGHFHGPTVAIFAHDLCRASRPLGGEQGCEGGRWLALSWSFGGRCALTSQHDDPHEASRQHRVPQPIPGVALRPRFAGVRRPSRGGLREGLGRAAQGALCARGAAPLRGWGWWHLIERGAA